MGLAVRVIPTLLCKGGHLVKGRQFSADRVVGHPLQAARIHAARGVDELALLDIEATSSGRGPDLQMIEDLSSVMFMPLSVGGGIDSLSAAKAVLRAGADKVIIGAGGPYVMREIADSIGCQAVVAAVDVKIKDGWGWAVERAKECERAGAGEILLTSVDREGTMAGYDLAMISAVSYHVKIPVIAHGGCSGPDDMIAAVKEGASAVAAGALFVFTDWTPKACAKHMAKEGIEVR